MVDYMIDRGLNLHESGDGSFYISDDQIRENVCELLARDPFIDASEIEVDVYKGFVILRGFVDSRQTKRLAELTVDDLPGVNDIINQLEFLTGTRHAF
jgi:osmotically-inducible protein OsmY